jgi:hypothetical protein
LRKQQLFEVNLGQLVATTYSWVTTSTQRLPLLTCVYMRLLQAWLKEQTTAEVFKVINALQHPADCPSARKLVCDLNKACGFACQIHHVVHCLTHAVALNRTMVLKVGRKQ